MIPQDHRDRGNRADPYTEPNSCFSDSSDSLNSLNSMKVPLHLEKTPVYNNEDRLRNTQCLTSMWLIWQNVYSEKTVYPASLYGVHQVIDYVESLALLLTLISVLELMRDCYSQVAMIIIASSWSLLSLRQLFNEWYEILIDLHCNARVRINLM